MTEHTPTDGHVQGTLGTVAGTGVVRLEVRCATGADELWSALTDRSRLADWLGEFDGDLSLGGEFEARYLASGWEGTGRVVACEPPRRLLALTASPGEPDGATEVTLTAEGELTTLVIEARGLPLDELAAYGAGNQIHVEDLVAHLAGRGRCDARARWTELHPRYAQLAEGLAHGGRPEERRTRRPG